jgi:hypothetical protein
MRLDWPSTVARRDGQRHPAVRQTADLVWRRIMLRQLRANRRGVGDRRDCGRLVHNLRLHDMCFLPLRRRATCLHAGMKTCQSGNERGRQLA